MRLADPPRLAILFWFYKDAPLARNRLLYLRKKNPRTPIFGLYGGNLAHAERFERALGPLLDDFWAFPDERESRWKWRNGDLLISRWFVERGEQLEWDSVFVAQWDLLVTAPISELLHDLRADDVVLSGVRPVAESLDWSWVKGTRRADYEEFVAHLRATYGDDVEPTRCLFIVACLPRRFLARYAAVDRPELGFLEYTVPTYAQVFGHRFGSDAAFRIFTTNTPRRSPGTGETDLSRRYQEKRQAYVLRRPRLIRAVGHSIALPVVLWHLLRADGQRVFHPFRRPFPPTPTWLVDRAKALRG